MSRLIGFTITALNNAREAAIEFVRIKAVISLERARAIVDAPVKVNVYCDGLRDRDLLGLPFNVLPVLAVTGLTVISTTPTVLELPREDGTTIKLLATLCKLVPPTYETLWAEYATRGMIRFVTVTGAGRDFYAPDFVNPDFFD